MSTSVGTSVGTSIGTESCEAPLADLIRVPSEKLRDSVEYRPMRAFINSWIDDGVYFVEVVGDHNERRVVKLGRITCTRLVCGACDGHGRLPRLLLFTKCCDACGGNGWLPSWLDAQMAWALTPSYQQPSLVSAPETGIR